jgi:hypothetical protein
MSRYALPVGVLLVVLLLAYVGMWQGWRRRGRRHDLAPLVPLPPVAQLPDATLEGAGRYFGTTVSGDWLDRVVARGLGPRSAVRLRLAPEGVDVVRVAGSFRIPRGALRGARHDQGIAGKVVPPHGLLVITWQHGDYLLDTGFRLSDPAGAASSDRAADGSVTAAHNTWVRTLSKIAKENT